MSEQVTVAVEVNPDVEHAMDIVNRATAMMQKCFQECEHDAVSFVLCKMLSPGFNPLDALEEWTLDAEMEFRKDLDDE